LAINYKHNLNNTKKADELFEKILTFKSLSVFTYGDPGFNLISFYFAQKELNKKIDKKIENNVKNILLSFEEFRPGNEYSYNPSIFFPTDIDSLKEQKKQILNEFSRLQTDEIYELLKSSTSGPLNFLGNLKQNKEKVIKKFINSNEDLTLEFKSSLLWSQKLTSFEITNTKSKEIKQFGKNASKIIIVRTINSFLNTKGGNLVIGVKETNEKNICTGIENDLNILKQKKGYSGEDGYRRFIQDELIKPYYDKEIFNFYDDYFKIFFEDYENKKFCIIKIIKSKEPVFINLNNQNEFWIRVDSEKRQLDNKQILNYFKKHF
jgi:hypothetical protein